MTNETQQAALQRLADRANTDAAFRTELLQDPAKAIQASGVAIPDDHEVHLFGSADSDVRLVMSPAAGELTEQDLNQLSGGTIFNLKVTCAPAKTTTEDGKTYTNLSNCPLVCKVTTA